MASIGSYLYAQSGNAIYVNLFAAGTAKIELPSQNSVRISQKTQYPWDGGIKIKIDPARPETFPVHIRIPGWTQNEVMPGGLYEYVDASDERPTLLLNGRAVDVKRQLGYAAIEHKWASGDEISLQLPMPVRRVRAFGRRRGSRHDCARTRAHRVLRRMARQRRTCPKHRCVG
jgi:uncharacterized protein